MEKRVAQLAINLWVINLQSGFSFKDVSYFIILPSCLCSVVIDIYSGYNKAKMVAYIVSIWQISPTTGPSTILSTSGSSAVTRWRPSLSTILTSGSSFPTRRATRWCQSIWMARICGISDRTLSSSRSARCSSSMYTAWLCMTAFSIGQTADTSTLRSTTRSSTNMYITKCSSMVNTLQDWTSGIPLPNLSQVSLYESQLQ